MSSPAPKTIAGTPPETTTPGPAAETGATAPGATPWAEATA